MAAAAAAAATTARRLDLGRLVSACVHLARRGGAIIREVHREGQLGAHNKKLEGDTRAAERMEPAEVLTIADTRSQDAIVTGLRAMFPGIRLVGEEDEQEPPPTTAGQREAPVALDQLPPLPSDFKVPPALAESLTLEDTCLWIDPLDGTIEFVRNNLHNVTVLIGVAIRDRPVAGIVHQPFVGGEDGTVTYGAVGVGVFGDRSPACGDPPEKLVLGMEAKHAALPRVKAAAERLSASAAAPVVTQGSGQNLLKVLRGETSVFVAGPGASRWDTCAGEALLAAVGGEVTNLDGSPYAYVQGAASYLNAEGLIAARTGEVHARVAKAVAETSEPEPKRARTADVVSACA